MSVFGSTQETNLYQRVNIQFAHKILKFNVSYNTHYLSQNICFIEYISSPLFTGTLNNLYSGLPSNPNFPIDISEVNTM